MDKSKTTDKFEYLKVKLCIAGIVLIVLMVFVVMQRDNARMMYNSTLEIGWLLKYTIWRKIFKDFALFAAIVYAAVGFYYIKKFLGVFTFLLALVFAVCSWSFTEVEEYKEYSVRGKEYSSIGLVQNLIRDLDEEYEVIECEDCFIQTGQYYTGWRHHREKHTCYYLNINNSTYVLPLPERVAQILQDSQATIHDVQVYANSKFIYAINGIPLNQITEENIQAGW